MDHESIKKLIFKIFILENGDTKCFNCNKILKLKEFKHNKMGTFFKYCTKCTKNHVWALTGNTDFTERGKKISIAKFKFFKTAKGKKIAKIVGEKNSKALTGRHLSDEQREKQSIAMIKLIKDGKFTPPINNNFTHWEAAYIDKNNVNRKYRSSWELCFHICNPQTIYEKIRIPYIDEKNKERIYVADFYDEKLKILYEIKPKCHFEKQKLKINAAIKYCLLNSIKFIWINEFNILQFLDVPLLENSNNDKIIENFNKLKHGIRNAK